MQYIRWLTSVKEKDAGAVGRKAAGLSRLSGLGFHVPDGFCVTVAAYQRFTASAEVQDVLNETARSCDADLGLCARRCQAIILGRPIPRVLKNQIGAAYNRLSGEGRGAVPVAVRSSGTAEDLPQVSFAGQYQTTLNARGERQVLEAVKSCWASLWSEQALHYRLRHKLPSDGAAMAVLVQRMVESDAAGVAFTIDPVSHNADEVVVNAGFGLGTAVVAGQLPSDTYILNKKSGCVVRQETVAKHLMVVGREDGGTRYVPAPPGKEFEAALTREQLGKLLSACLKVEEHFGCPQDIEWAYSSDTLYLLQSRPVTALKSKPDFPAVWADPSDAALPWVRAGAEEIAPAPLCAWDVHLMMMWRDAFNEARKSWHSAYTYRLLVMNGYLYMTDTPLPLGEKEIAARRRDYEEAVAELMDAVPDRWQREWLPELERDLDAWSRFDKKRASLAGLLRHLREVLRRRERHEYIGAVVGFVAVPALENFQHTFDELLGSDAALVANRLLQGLRSKVHEMEDALWELAQRVEREAALCHLILENEPEQSLGLIRETPGWQLIQSFLDEYGYYGGADNILTPPWAERPALLLSILRQRVRRDEEVPAERLRRLVRERDAAVREARASLTRSGDPGHLNRFARDLKRVQECIPGSQDRYVVIFQKGYFALRQLLLEVGLRFAEATWLEQAEDVFYLTPDEVLTGGPDRAGGSWREKVATRREELVRFSQVTPPELLGAPPAPLNPALKYQADAMYPAPEGLRPKTRQADARGHPKSAAAATGGAVLRGLAGSPGHVRGPARVVSEVAEAGRVIRGDILVSPMTTPAWTALFGMIAGVVTEMGGMLSHPAVIAREFGIPAVVGVEGATRAIRRDQVITLDGSAGCVYLEARPDS